MSYEDKVNIVSVIGIVFVIALILIGSAKTGAYAENDRLYKKCLAQNSEMMYNKAIEFCEEQVK